MVVHHLGVHAIRSEVKPWFNHRIQSPQRSAAVPTWREDVQREKIAWVFYWWTVFLRTRSPLPRRAAATICLPSRCGAGSLPGQKSRVPTCGFGVGSLVCCAFNNSHSTVMWIMGRSRTKRTADPNAGREALSQANRTPRINDRDNYGYNKTSEMCGSG